MRAGVMPGGFEKLKSALDVCFQISAGGLDRVADASLRGEMNDMVGRILIQQVGKEAGRFDASLHLDIVRMFGKAQRAVAFQGWVIVFGESIKAHDAPTFVQPAFRCVISDEPGSACNERRFHVASLATCFR